MSDTYADVAKPDDIARRWPDGREMPPLIRSVADYIRGKPWMSLGAARMVGDRMDDYWIENGADLWRDFGIFMRLPDGSRVAQWFRDGDTGEPPIVLIGSEGEQLVLAPNLEAFFAAWALASFNAAGDLTVGAVSVGLPSDLIRDDENDDVADGRPAFAAFLKNHLRRDTNDLIAVKPDDKPLQDFFAAWGEGARVEIKANATLQKIATILDADIPRGKEVWERETLRIAAVGERLEISGKGHPLQPLDETRARALRPVVSAERERRAGGVHAPRGLWHSANLLLYPDGTCQIAADWEAAPEFRHGAQASAADFAADLKRFPRSARWIEPWLAAP